MAIDWSDNILLANLSDEPALSEELGLVIDQIKDASETPHAVLDFRGVSYVNSSNIAQLLRMRKILDEAGRQMRVCGVSDEVWSVMLVTGLDKVFRFAPDTMTALAGLQLDDAAGLDA
ncbi:MAG: STAS domain-containing protein [Phycisphaerales bacterium]